MLDLKRAIGEPLRQDPLPGDLELPHSGRHVVDIIGDRRPPSKLGDIQPDHWLAEYTTELLNVLHVLGLLVEIEPDQAKLMEAICEGATLDFRR
jgi:hypothetical protein